MLAISTRMTLTQVSTWFANARRRMKKDNIGEYDDNDESKEGEIGKHISIYFRLMKSIYRFLQ